MTETADIYAPEACFLSSVALHSIQKAFMKKLGLFGILAGVALMFFSHGVTHGQPKKKTRKSTMVEKEYRRQRVLRIASQNQLINKRAGAKTSSAVEVRGEYLQAFLVAYQAFQKIPDLPPQKKHISNYEVEFKQDSQSYYVHLIPKYVGTRTIRYVGGENPLGRETRYSVRRSDFKITQRLYYE